MFYREFDLASYRLRYHRTWTVFKDAAGELFFAYVGEIGEREWYLSMYEDGELRDRSYPLHAVAPAYYFIESGFYPGQRYSDRVFIVMRKLIKSFQVGMSQYNYIQQPLLYADRRSQDTPNILKPLEVDVPKALEHQGLLSKRLFVDQSKVYYLNKTVGLRNKKNFVMSPVFKSEMEDCLRGHECTIKL